MMDRYEAPEPYRISPPATLSLQDLVCRFDERMQPWKGMNEVKPPTSASIKRISGELKIELPESLVEFARRSERFGAWFAGLGEDCDSPFHTLQLNSQAHEASAVDGVPMPPHPVMINQGYDEDYECFDLRRGRQAGEYSIRYWSPGVATWSLSPSFPAYVEDFVRTR
jgi:hypothetical protein